MLGQIVLGTQMLGALPPIVDTVVLATDALVPSETLAAGVEYVGNFDDTLTLSDTLGLEFLEDITDTLVDTSAFDEVQPLVETLTETEDWATLHVARLAGSDTLVPIESWPTGVDPLEYFSDTLIATDLFEQDLYKLADSLTATDTFFSGNIDRVSLSDALTFVEVWKSEIDNFNDSLSTSDSFTSNKFEYVGWSDTLVPSETLDGRAGDLLDTLSAVETFTALGPFYETLPETLTPIETFTSNADQNIYHSDLLSNFDEWVTGETDGFSDTLSATEEWTQHEPVDILIPTETYDSYISYGYVDLLELVESFSSDGTEQSVAISDTLTPTEGWVDVVLDSTIHREYRPSGNSDIPVTQPVLSCANVITFEFPPISPSVTLTLKRPTLGDRHGYFAQRIVRPSRGGTLRVGTYSDWPKFDTLNLQFVALSKADKDAILSLFGTSLGKSVKYTDYESREWEGVISDPQVVENHLTCGFDVSLQFEGALA